MCIRDRHDRLEVERRIGRIGIGRDAPGVHPLDRRAQLGVLPRLREAALGFDDERPAAGIEGAAIAVQRYMPEDDEIVDGDRRGADQDQVIEVLVPARVVRPDLELVAAADKSRKLESCLRELETGPRVTLYRNRPLSAGDSVSYTHLTL